MNNVSEKKLGRIALKCFLINIFFMCLILYVYEAVKMGPSWPTFLSVTNWWLSILIIVTGSIIAAVCMAISLRLIYVLRS